MKLTAFFLLTALLHICTPALCQRVTISGKDLTLEQIFMEMQKQTGMEFFFQSALLKGTRRVTLNVQQMPIDEVLTICLQGQGLGFNIRSGTIIIFKPDNRDQTTQPDKSVSADSTMLFKGQVVDARGLPVEMASVVLLRTYAGTQTDRSGYFTLKVKSLLTTDSLDISFIGLKSRRIRLDGKTTLGQIVLQPADNVLDETIITAYGTTSERFRTGDITTIKAIDIEKTPALNVLEALAGRVPGLYIRQTGSNPGSVYNIQFRGVNVIPPTGDMARNGATEILSKPLIVLDDLPLAPDVVNESGENLGVDAITKLTGDGGGQDPLYWLNPLDVESITVLKDADATALYGSRAANGVIIITTKKGKPGKTSLTITANTGFNTQASRLKLLNTQQYLAMRHEALNNTKQAGLPIYDDYGGNSYTPNDTNSYDLLLWDTTRYTDWQQVLLGSAPNYNVYVGLSGGKGHTEFRLGAGYNKSQSSYPNAKGTPDFREEKGSLSLSGSTRSRNNRLKLTGLVITSVTASWQPLANGVDRIDEKIFMAPNAPAVFDEAGHLNFVDWRHPSFSPEGFLYNPFRNLACPYQSNRFGLQVRTNVSYTFFPSLIFTAGIGYSGSKGRQSSRQPGSAIDPLVPDNYRWAIFGNSNGTALNIEPKLSYEIRLGRHQLALLAGGSYQFDKQEGHNIAVSGYTSDEQMNSPAAGITLADNFNFIERKSLSAWARASYRYADEFLVDLSGRRDGSSTFGPKRRFGNFGSLGLGWIFTQEPWCSHIPLLAFGKIRGSYGITGSQSATPFTHPVAFRPASGTYIYFPATIATFSRDGSYQGVGGLTIPLVSNPALGWAQASSVDLGIDLYFLTNQQLKLTAQWYRKRTGNQLVTQRISSVTGLTDYLANVPAVVENSGLEGDVSYCAPVKNSGVNWNISLNIAANRNKLLSYPDMENSPFGFLFEPGQSLINNRIFTTFLDKRTGTYTYNDPDHVATPVARRVNSLPVLIGGMQATVSWKGFSVSISCTFAKQKAFNYIAGRLLPGALGDNGLSNQLLSAIKDRHWQSPADSTLGGALYTDARYRVGNQLDIYWVDASYITLKNASFKYSFRESLLRKMGVGHLNIYINAQNLLIIPLNGYKSFNPELPGEIVPLRMILVGGFEINL